VIKFPAANFALIMQNLTLVYTDALKRTGVVSNDDIKLYDRSVIDALDHSKDVGLALSKMSLERLSEALRKGQMTYEEVKAGVNDVLDRMNDETFSQLFIQIPSEVASYYADDPQFGEQSRGQGHHTAFGPPPREPYQHVRGLYARARTRSPRADGAAPAHGPSFLAAVQTSVRNI